MSQGPREFSWRAPRLCSILGPEAGVYGLSVRLPEYGPVCDAPPLDRGFRRADRVSVTSRDGGLTTATWQHDGLDYVIVSNALLSELEPFIAHFRRTGL